MKQAVATAPATTETQPYTGFDRNVWLVAGGLLVLLGLLAIMSAQSILFLPA